MLYHLFSWLHTAYQVPGAGLFNYISFRAGMAVILALVISVVLGDKIIKKLLSLQIGETVRDLGLDGQKQKQGTPTMGGFIIIASILIPTLLFANLTNIYIITLIISTVWLGAIGFMDDYIKVFKKDKDGLSGRYKIIGQVGLGIFVGCIMFFHPDVKVRDLDNVYVYTTKDGKIYDQNPVSILKADTVIPGTGKMDGSLMYSHDVRSLMTNMPFIKGNSFSYEAFTEMFGLSSKWAWIFFIPIVIFIITAVSNGANITDGIDGLATGSSAIIGSALIILTYISGNRIFSEYLNIMYIPNLGELSIFVSAFVAACIGFLWWNSYPAQVFMGDTGSLALGGIIATIAIIIRKELMIPVLCGVFLIENLSVIMQVSYFKYTKKKYGEGRRIFKMSPLHHHYQKSGMHEAKIVARFWIIGIFLAVLTIITLKIR
jgi:phospho-N-acetylmuramoyl-pentapeptide-transferase